MSNIDKENQCFFQDCKLEAKKWILYRDQRVKVCTVHDQRYGHSHEMGNKRIAG